VRVYRLSGVGEFPYEKYRLGQREAIKDIRYSLGSVIGFRAPTGFGKTIVAVYSHLGVGRKVYAVRTRNEMAPVVRELRRVGAPYTIIFSGRRSCPLLRGKSAPPPEDFWANCRVLRSKHMCPYYINLGGVSDDEIRETMDQVPPDPHAITKKLADALGVCPFFALSRLIPSSEFVVVTYPYVFREEVWSTAFPDEDDISQYYLILDEAHTLINPQSLADAEVSEFDIERTIKEVRKFSLGEEVFRYVNALKSALTHAGRLLKRVPEELVRPDQFTLELLNDAVITVRLEILRSMALGEAATLSTAVAKVAKFAYYAFQPDFRVYAIRTGDAAYLKAYPVSFRIVKEKVGAAKGALLMSGTLPPKRVLEEIVGKEVKYFDAEKDYGVDFVRRNRAVIAYTAVTSRYAERSPKTYEEYARLVNAVARAVEEGVVLAVYPSYDFMEKVAMLTEASIPNLVEGRESTIGEVMDALNRAGKAVLHAVAGGKFTEGIELVEGGRSIIRAVVVCGVPYPQPDDYVRDLRSELVNSVGPEAAKELTMTVPAAIRAAQAIGRAVRSPLDRAVAVLGDRRFMNPRLWGLMGVGRPRPVKDLRELEKLVRAFEAGLI
jgi:DNA excision repair protein ERCC-2